MKTTLGFATLSWHSTLTLRNTLESYKYYGLDKLADEKVIFFQEITDEDKNIAESFGYTAIGSPNNIGIGAAYKELVNNTTSDLFLFLENDFVLIERPQQQILDAITMIEQNITDVARFRHRKYPGTPLWSRQFAGNETNRPEFLLESIHWTDPSKFKEVQQVGKWYITTSPFANWSNNPHLARTEWLRRYIYPRAVGDIERGIQEWWLQQNFKVAQGEGLFKHERID